MGFRTFKIKDGHMSRADAVKKVMIVGSSGGIGMALVRYCLEIGCQVAALTRSPSPALAALQQAVPNRLAIVECDLLDHQPQVEARLSLLFARYGYPDWIINAAGFLHAGTTSHSDLHKGLKDGLNKGASVAHIKREPLNQSRIPTASTQPQISQCQMPEKRLSEITPAFLEHNLRANLYLSIALAQCCDNLLPRSTPFRFACLSAMVGSIADNHSGGWYSYRISKAALNMFLKTLSLEWKRQFPNACVAAIHPGTTDTQLSAPFQSRITASKLYSSDISAQRIVSVIESMTPEQSGHFYHWDGSVLPW